MEPDELFHYVIARPWDDANPENLSIYAYGSQVHQGTMKNAKSLLKYVNSEYSLPNKDKRPYSIYQVNFVKLEDPVDVTE